MGDTTITELDGLYREAVAMSDWSAADHYDRQISLKMTEMYKSGELDYYDDDNYQEPLYNKGMKIKYIIDVSPITDQFVLLDARDGDGADINHKVAMMLFNDCADESFFSSLAVERIQSLERHLAIERIESIERRSKELFEGTTEALSHLTAMVQELRYNIGMTNYNNEMKIHTLNQLASALRVVGDKMNILDMLDNDSSESGCMDIHDQIGTMYKNLNGIEGAVKRATSIVPGEQEHSYNRGVTNILTTTHIMTIGELIERLEEAKDAVGEDVGTICIATQLAI